jgi:DNA-binding response OmpR family regulator
VITKVDIAEHLWGDNIELADNFNFVYTHVRNLRRKLEKMGSKDYLKTIYKMGYKFIER